MSSPQMRNSTLNGEDEDETINILEVKLEEIEKKLLDTQTEYETL